MWTALSGAPWWQRSGVPSTPFTHDERGHQQASARVWTVGVWMVRIGRSPRRDLCWCACAKHCTCAGSSHGFVSSRRSLDLGDGFVKDHWSLVGGASSHVAKAG